MNANEARDQSYTLLIKVGDSFTESVKRNPSLGTLLNLL